MFTHGNNSDKSLKPTSRTTPDFRDKPPSALNKILRSSRHQKQKTRFQAKDSTLSKTCAPRDTSPDHNKASGQPFHTNMVHPPTASVSRNFQPHNAFEEPSNHHTTIPDSLQQVSRRVAVEQETPMPGAYPHDDGPGATSQGVPALEPLPSSLESLFEEPTEPTHLVAGRGNQYPPATTDTGSAPTQIFDPSESATSGFRSLANSLSDVQGELDSLCEPGYEHTDDFAGIGQVHNTIEPTSFSSSGDMSVHLSRMAGQLSVTESWSLQVSLTPFLVAPASYIRLLDEVTSLVKERIDLFKRYISAWILMAVTSCRIDGLRLNTAVHLSIRNLPATQREDFDSKPARLARLAKQTWFSDPAHHEPVYVVPRSINSSKVLAVISGPYQDAKKRNTTLMEVPLVERGIEVLSREPVREIPVTDHKINGVSVNENNDLPVTYREASPKTSMEKTWTSQEQEILIPTEAELLQTPHTDSLSGIKTDSPSRSSVCQGLDAALERERSQSPILGRSVSGRQPARASTADDDERLVCEHPECKLKTFVDKKGLLKHLETQHRDERYDVVDHTEDTFERPATSSARRARSTSDLAREYVLPSTQDLRVCSWKEASCFFVPGRVFAMLWQRILNPWLPLQLSNAQSSFLNAPTGSRGELTLWQIRRFVVIIARTGYCHALPIYVSNSLDTSRGTVLGEHGQSHTIIHDSAKSPKSTLEEPRSTKKPIPVTMWPGETLDRRSRIDFGRIQTIDWGNKVRIVGMVMGGQNICRLQSYFKMEFAREEETESIIDNEEDENEVGFDSEGTHPMLAGESGRAPSNRWVLVSSPEKYNQRRLRRKVYVQGYPKISSLQRHDLATI